MRVHGSITAWDSHVIVKQPAGGLHWLQRLRHWLAPQRPQHHPTTPTGLDGRWHARRERFQPPTTESALEHAVAQAGPAVAITLYSSIL